MATSRLVFLTGATGFIGGRLAAALVARGYRLRCLVRAPARAAALGRLGAELIEGDVAAPEAVARGIEGADVACHLAAIYDIGVVAAAELERVNVEGTRVFLRAAEAAGVPRSVYVSSTVALGPVPAGEGDERSHWDGPFPTVYHRTKTEAHALALQAQAEGLPLVIACPAWVYGPGDRGPGGRMLADLLRGRLPALVREAGWFSFVHVDDVVQGLVAALERGRPGATYVLGGEAASFTAFVERAAALAGVEPPRWRLPAALAGGAGALLDAVSRLTGRRFVLSREGVASVARGRWLHSYRLAAAELDYAPRPLAAGLAGTVTWIQGQIESEG